MNARRRSPAFALGCLAMLLCALGLAPKAHAANSSPCTVAATTLKMPTSVTISSSTQPGPIGSAAQVTVTFTCAQKAFSGSPANTTIQANISGLSAVLSSTSGYFPSGINGISVLFSMATSAGNGESVPPSGQIDNPGMGNGRQALFTMLDPKNTTITDTLQFTAQLYVTGPVTSGGTTTLTQLISNFQNYTFGSTDSSSTYGSLSITPVVVTRSSCSGASPNVTLPPVFTSALNTAGATSGQTPFSLNITGCPNGTKLAISFSGTQAGTSTTVSQSTGSANNVGVQLLTSAKAAVDITGTQTTSLGTVANGGSLSVPYYAQYYATGQATAGTVAAAVTYTLTYP
jgi:major type 1 subunit fimbrin (pilin)